VILSSDTDTVTKVNNITTRTTNGTLDIASGQTEGGLVYIGTDAITKTTIRGTKFPLIVFGPSEYGAAFVPENGYNKKGDFSIWATFPNITLPIPDINPRRICDITAGFASNSWLSGYISLCVGPTNGIQNDLQTVTEEQMRISQSTITMNKPITIGYTIAPAVNQIGYIKSVNIDSGTGNLSNTVTKYAQLQLEAGVWMVFVRLHISGLDAGTTMTLYQSDTEAISLPFTDSFVTLESQYTFCSTVSFQSSTITTIVHQTSTKYIWMVASTNNLSAVGNIIGGGNMKAVRIA